jgi:DNA-binding beta-propeller fold protein YncE
MAMAIGLVMLAACGGGSSTGTGGASTPAPVTTLSLVAGNAVDVGSLDGAGAAARFNKPAGIAIDTSGNLYLADQGNCSIRKITPAGAVSTLAGSPQRCESVDGSGGAAGFFFLTALAAAPDGRLYAIDGLAIREISPAGAVRTVATLDTATVIAASEVPYFYGAGIAVDSAGNVVVANAVGTRAISPAGAFTMLEGVATLDSLLNVWGSHAFAQRGVAAGANKVVWVGDAANTVSRIDASGKKTAIAGLSGATGFADGSGSVARFERAVALTSDAQGNVFVADAGNNLIRKIAPDQMVTTVAGTVGAASLQLGPAPGALPALAGLTGDGKGNLYAIAGNAVVKITLP